MTLEERVRALEEELAKLRDQLQSTEPWWQQITGMFADDPLYK